MNKHLLPAALLVAASALLAGCSTPSVITLNDGREIQATRINKDQVRTIKEL